MQPDREAASRDAEACFKQLESLDLALLTLLKAEAEAERAAQRAGAADQIAAAVQQLDGVLSQLTPDVMAAARAALV